MSDVPAAAPAQPEPVAEITLTPVQQAVADKDYSTFERLEREAKSGPPAPAPAKPVDQPKTEAVAPAPAQPEAPKPVSKRQQQINDYERTIAELKAENARLRVPAPAPAPAQEPKAPTLSDTIARPDISTPPLSEADFYAKFQDASVGDYAEYRAAHRIARETAARAQAAERDAREQDRSARFDKAQASVRTITEDPEFEASVLPLMAQLRTSEQATADREPITPLHTFADHLIESEVAGPLLKHLVANPDVLQSIRALKTPRQVIQFFGRLEAKFLDAPADKPAAPVLKTVPAAPEPPAALGSRPASPADPRASAITGGDYLAFERVERERLAGRR